jgi:hypothetical protein
MVYFGTLMMLGILITAYLVFVVMAGSMAYEALMHHGEVLLAVLVFACFSIVFGVVLAIVASVVIETTTDVVVS